MWIQEATILLSDNCMQSDLDFLQDSHSLINFTDGHNKTPVTILIADQ